MAHYVEPHFNPRTNSKVPGYWNPDYSMMATDVVPCSTKQEAEALEREADRVRGIILMQQSMAMGA